MEKIVFNEVYDIIMCMDKRYQNKIPEKFMSFISMNRDVFYSSNITTLPSNLDNVQKDTKTMLAIIYDKFIKNSELDVNNIQETTKSKSLDNNEQNVSLVIEDEISIESKNVEEIVLIKNNSFINKIKRMFSKLKFFCNFKNNEK